MATIKTDLKLTQYGEELKKQKDLNELEQMFIDGIVDLKERQFVILFKNSQVKEFQKCFVNSLNVIDFDGYFYCYFDLSNGSRKELKELTGGKAV